MWEGVRCVGKGVVCGVWGGKRRNQCEHTLLHAALHLESLTFQTLLKKQVRTLKHLFTQFPSHTIYTNIKHVICDSNEMALQILCEVVIEAGVHNDLEYNWPHPINKPLVCPISSVTQMMYM